MDLLRVEKPVMLKGSSSAYDQLAALEALRGTLTPPLARRLEADIARAKAGIVGEERVMYELENSHMGMYVLRDLYLEHEGLSAQIDFLVITRQRNFIIECKNLWGNVRVDSKGEFTRILPGNRREAIYSPITQNRRHLELIRAVREDSRGAVANLLFGGGFDDVYRSLVVLANPRSALNDRYAKKEVKRQLVRVDGLVEAIRSQNAESGPGHDRSLDSVARRLAEWFLEQGRDCPVDYTAKYPD